MSVIPFISLGIAGAFGYLALHRSRTFADRPYLHWFLYFHMTAVGLHQFEEYGWPGHFRDAFVTVFGTAGAQTLVPTATELELLNAFGFTTLFAVVGWFGSRYVWLGLWLLFTNFANGFFHLITSVIHMSYIPGTVTGTLLYLPLGLLATRFAILRGDIGAGGLVAAFAAGVIASLLPFLHVWLLLWTN